MTEGHGTCGQPTGGRKRPQRGRTTSSLVLFAPFGDDWGEQVYYPQVTFPSVIPPAVIHIRPLRGRQDAACETSVKFYYYLLQVSQVTSGPRRGPTINNRWWNDRRSWNLRTTDRREKASPKGANNIQSCIVRPLRGRLGRAGLLSAGYIPFGHSTSGYSHSPPSGTIGERRSTIRRLHSLRSFHQRLFTFAPFGDSKMLLAKLQLNFIIIFYHSISFQHPKAS